MSPVQLLADAKRVFLDTAPIIYYLEAHPTYAPTIEGLFDRLDRNEISAVTSPVTLLESLIQPIRYGDTRLIDQFTTLITRGAGITFVSLDLEIALLAAEVRAKQRLNLADAMQVATALALRCDTLLTNDIELRRVTDIAVVVVNDLVGQAQP